MLMKNSLHNKNGFTLVELMVTVAIAAILMAVGLPSLRDFIQNARITTVTNELVSALNKARTEAIKNNAFACVCQSKDTDAAAPTCAGGGEWETGFIAFSDFNGDCMINATADVPPKVDVLTKVWNGSEYGDQMTVRTTHASITATNAILFNSRGEPRQADGSNQQGVFTICDDRGLVGSNDKSSTAAGVVLSAAGSARSTRNMTQISACP